MLAGRTFIRAGLLSLFTIVLTILLGRVFCGWICPLGTTLDISDRLFFKRRNPHKVVQYRRLKYYILAGLFVTALFSMQAVYFLDPLCLLTRSIALVFIAPIQLALQSLWNLLMGWSGSSFGPLASSSTWISDKMGMWSFITNPQVYYRESFVFLAIFVGIVGLSSLSRRFWCRNLCPLGALLGLFARVPLLKRVVTHECIECGKCIRDCKMAAIPENPHLTRSSECIECFDCVPICPKDAESFRARPKPEYNPETKLNLSRRKLLQGAGVGLAFAALAKVDPARKYAAQATDVKISSPALIRPPHARPENEFINQCVRCGACMKACPSSGLQPALEEAGVEGLWTPVLVPKIGPCVQECNACGNVCPTDAIRKFKIADKPGIVLGNAMVDRSHCLAWSGGHQCLVCKEYCPYQAIDVKVVGPVGCPVVNTHKCVGCGACENACPIQPEAAIRVYSRGAKR